MPLPCIIKQKNENVKNTPILTYLDLCHLKNICKSFLMTPEVTLSAHVRPLLLVSRDCLLETLVAVTAQGTCVT